MVLHSRSLAPHVVSLNFVVQSSGMYFQLLNHFEPIDNMKPKPTKYLLFGLVSTDPFRVNTPLASRAFMSVTKPCTRSARFLAD